MEIELYSKIQDPWTFIRAGGEAVAKSGMFGCTRVEEGMVIVWACMAEKKSPFEIKRTYHLMNGELSMRADAMLAQFRSKGGKHKVIERTSEKASVELEMNGDKQTFTFTWEAAKQEPFVWSNQKTTGGQSIPKKNWNTPRARMQMLWARVISDGVRTMAPEIVSGVYTPEERDDEAQLVQPKSLFPETAQQPINITPLPANGGNKSPEPVAGAQVVAPQPPPQNRNVGAPEPQRAFVSAPQADPQTQAAKIVEAAMDPQTKRLTTATVQALEAAIGEPNAAAALDWLKAQEKIKTNLSEMSVKFANAILKRPQAFLDQVKQTTQEVSSV